MDTSQLLQLFWPSFQQKAQPWANLNVSGTPASPGAQATSAPPPQQQAPQQQAPMQPQQPAPIQAPMNPAENMTVTGQAPQQVQQPSIMQTIQQPQISDPGNLYPALMQPPQLGGGGSGSGGSSDPFSKLGNTIKGAQGLIKMLGSL